MFGNRFFARVAKLTVVVAILVLAPAGLVSAQVTTPGGEVPTLHVSTGDGASELDAARAVAKSRVTSVLAKSVPTPIPFISREERIRQCQALKALRDNSPSQTSGSSNGNGNGKGGGKGGGCGNGSCDSANGETCSSCPGDCGSCPPPPPYCGNGTCDPGEPITCIDCQPEVPNRPRCGDGICLWPFENINICWVDCPCQTPLGGPIC